MSLIETQTLELQEYIESHFAGLSTKDQIDLLAEGLDFLARRKISQLTDKSRESFEKHLEAHRRKQISENRGIVLPENSRVDRISDLALPRMEPGKPPSDEDNLARYSSRGRVPHSAELVNLEQELQLSEQELESWQLRLPPIEFEALKLRTVPDTTPYLTAGIANRGWVFFRRARIRMEWLRLSERSNST